MALALSDLVKETTREEVLEDLLLLASLFKLSTTAWQPGEPILALMTILAEQIAKLWNNIIVKAIRGGLLDYAEGAWLTLLAFVVYGVTRREATFAGGKCTIENRAGGFYTLSPGDLRIKNSVGKTYFNVTGGELTPWSGSGDYPELELDWQADEAGTGSDAAALDIQEELVLGFAGIYARPNAAAFAGEDEEEDPELKERCRASKGPLSPAGPKDAYRYVALSTKRADGTSVNVTRVRVINIGAGAVDVWLAGPLGGATGDTGTPGSDVYLVNSEIQEKVVPEGFTANVASSPDHSMDVTVTLYVDRKSLLTVAEAEAKGRAAVQAFFKRLPIGGNRKAPGTGYVFIDEVKGKASESAEGIIKADVTLAAGTADVALAESENAVPANLSVTAILVTQ